MMRIKKKPTKTATTPPSETPTTPEKSKKPSPNVGEVAGGTAADIFVVCCCCPCGLAECLILAAYRIPVNLVRRMWRKRRQKKLCLMKNSAKAFLEDRNGGGCRGGGGGGELGFCDEEEMKKGVANDGLNNVEEEFDRRMWDQFSDTGFWRTCSQRHT